MIREDNYIIYDQFGEKQSCFQGIDGCFSHYFDVSEIENVIDQLDIISRMLIVITSEWSEDHNIVKKKYH